jgi:hypothetical protein
METEKATFQAKELGTEETNTENAAAEAANEKKEPINPNIGDGELFKLLNRIVDQETGIITETSAMPVAQGCVLKSTVKRPSLPPIAVSHLFDVVKVTLSNTTNEFDGTENLPKSIIVGNEEIQVPSETTTQEPKDEKTETETKTEHSTDLILDLGFAIAQMAANTYQIKETICFVQAAKLTKAQDGEYWIMH